MGGWVGGLGLYLADAAEGGNTSLKQVVLGEIGDLGEGGWVGEFFVC